MQRVLELRISDPAGCFRKCRKVIWPNAHVAAHMPLPQYTRKAVLVSHLEPQTPTNTHDTSLASTSLQLPPQCNPPAPPPASSPSSPPSPHSPPPPLPQPGIIPPSSPPTHTSPGPETASSSPGSAAGRPKPRLRTTTPSGPKSGTESVMGSVLLFPLPPVPLPLLTYSPSRPRLHPRL